MPLNSHPLAARARAAGVPLIGDIELFAQARAELPPHKVVGITGTNGKSTTTALVTHILNEAGMPALMGGNIGLPILGQEPLPAGGVYVLELSSYQLDLTQTLACDVAVLLNVTPDHLDRYDAGFAGYLASKIRLLEMQRADDVAIVADGGNGVREAVLALTVGAELTQWFGGDFLTDFAGEQAGWPALQGPHNAQNAWAARMVCLALGLAPAAINRGLASYQSLPHRMERVGEHGGVLFVNDSKATNPASTAPALAAFPPAPAKRLHWICGGLPKEDNLDECAPHFGNVAAAYTIGEAGPLFAALLEPHMPVERCEMLAEAVRRAMAGAQPGDVVLFSPACASFDQYRDYEIRGETFRTLVSQLAGDRWRSASMTSGSAATGPLRQPAVPASSKGRELLVWWRELDRVLLLLALGLMVIGALAVAAASPASARRLSTEGVQLDDLHFFWLQLRWQCAGLALLLAASLMDRELLRRVAIVISALMLAGLLLVPVIGAEVNGARRWLDLGLSVQPSEFLKPAFAVTLAWVLSWKQRDPTLPVFTVSTGLLLVIVILLMLQPNFGEALLFCGLWLVLVVLAGLPMQRFWQIGGAGLAGIAVVLLVYENGRNRLAAFLGGGSAWDQVDLANRTLTGGGWTGSGFWLGENKMRLPEAHTDYIFSVIGEEFGLLVCAIVVMMYLAIVLRVLVRLVEEERLFVILAATGLVVLFGAQAFINILVNLQLFPSKGMTLPLVSYGGSSTIGTVFHHWHAAGGDPAQPLSQPREV